MDLETSVVVVEYEGIGVEGTFSRFGFFVSRDGDDESGVVNSDERVDLETDDGGRQNSTKSWQQLLSRRQDCRQLQVDSSFMFVEDGDKAVECLE